MINQKSWCVIVALSVLCSSGCYVRYEAHSTRPGSAIPRSDEGGQTANWGPSLEFVVQQTEPAVTGTWSGIAGKNAVTTDRRVWVTVKITRDHHESGVGAMLREEEFKFLLADEAASWPGNLACARDAGKLELNGKRKESRFEGQFTFVPNADYAREASSRLLPPPTEVELFRLVLSDVRRTELAAYVRAGIPLGAGDLCGLKAYNVAPDYLAAVLKGGDFSIDDVKHLHRYGVPAEYPAGCRKSGLTFTAHDLSTLHSYGVPAGELVDWAKTGYGFSFTDMARLHSFGVSPAFGRAVRNSFEQATMDDLIKLHSFGVSAQYLDGVKTVGATFAVPELIRLKSYGVSPEEIGEWHKVAGDFGSDDLVRLHSYGVSPLYVSALNSTNFDVGDLIKLKSMGVSAEETVKWRDLGYKLAAQDLVKLHAAGVSADYAASVKVVNRPLLPVDTLIRLKQRGLSIEEIRQLRE